MNLTTLTEKRPGASMGANSMLSLRFVALVFAILLLYSAPSMLGKYYSTLMIPFFGYAIALLGFNLLFGYGGLLSFGHAMFIALGAYAAAVVYTIFGIVSFEYMLIGAIVAALIVSTPIAWLTSRYTGIFFGMLTLSFGMLFHSFLNKFYDITGGEGGMIIPRPALLGLDLDAYDQLSFLSGPFYYYCLTLAVVCAWLMYRIVGSPFCASLMATREHPTKAMYLGVSIRSIRARAFVISAIYGAVGGVILGVQTGLADPELAYWTQSGNVVFMTVLGGFRELFGPVIGAFTFVLLQDELSSITQYWRFFLGLTLAVLVLKAPNGIAGGIRQLLKKRLKPSR